MREMTALRALRRELHVLLRGISFSQVLSEKLTIDMLLVVPGGRTSTCGQWERTDKMNRETRDVGLGNESKTDCDGELENTAY